MCSNERFASSDRRHPVGRGRSRADGTQTGLCHRQVEQQVRKPDLMKSEHQLQRRVPLTRPRSGSSPPRPPDPSPTPALVSPSAPRPGRTAAWRSSPRANPPPGGSPPRRPPPRREALPAPTGPSNRPTRQQHQLGHPQHQRHRPSSAWRQTGRQHAEGHGCRLARTPPPAQKPRYWKPLPNRPITVHYLPEIQPMTDRTILTTTQGTTVSIVRNQRVHPQPHPRED